MIADTFWRALTTLLRIDMAIGIILTVVLLLWLGWLTQ
jgi:hypothetical protein